MKCSFQDNISLRKHYSIVRMISRGGFGTVYEAINLTNSHRCALKAIDIIGFNERSFDYFLNEGRILKNVSPHQHIVKFFQESIFGTTRAIELELLECSLQDLLVSRSATGTEMLESEAIVIVKSILLGLQHLHKADIVHRDIKPENVGFLKADHLESLKIFDFGLSAQLSIEDNRMMTNMVGTIVYMAPEMFTKSEYNAVS